MYKPNSLFFITCILILSKINIQACQKREVNEFFTVAKVLNGHTSESAFMPFEKKSTHLQDQMPNVDSKQSGDIKSSSILCKICVKYPPLPETDKDRNFGNSHFYSGEKPSLH